MSKKTQPRKTINLAPSGTGTSIIDKILNKEIIVSSEKELLDLGLTQDEINKLKSLSILKFENKI